MWGHVLVSEEKERRTRYTRSTVVPRAGDLRAKEDARGARAEVEHELRVGGGRELRQRQADVHVRLVGERVARAQRERVAQAACTRAQSRE